MGLGIGLGGFVDGFKTGWGIQQNNEQRQWEREDRAFATTQRDREVKDQGAIDAIRSDAKQTFDQGVASGQYKPDDFDAFWTSYALPKMKHELLLEGKTDEANKLQEWGDSQSAKKGGRLFASAMFKAQAGDPGGALDDAIDAGKVQGYINHDFEFAGKEEIKDANGNVVGFRVTMKDGKGNELEQDVAVDDVPRVVATFANPAAAWQSQQDSAAAERKRGEDLSDYKTKKEIDQATSGAPAKDRSKAITDLRKRSTDAAALDPDAVGFDALPADQQELQIQQELDLQRGTRPAPVPTPSIVVDGQTGQQATGVGAPQPQPASQAVGIGAQAPVAPAPAPNPVTAQLTNDQARRLSGATELMQRGDLDGARRLLSDSGVPTQSWPAALQPAPDPRYAGLAMPVQAQ